jgi:hypothetical protein
MRGPHSGVAVGLQLGSDTLALGSLTAAARFQDSQQVPGVSYRPFLESGALRQMQGLPEQAFACS